MKIIYCFLIAVAFAGAAWAMKKEEAIQALQNFGGNCDPEPSQADYEAIVTNNPNPEKTAKCFRHCLMKQFELLTPANKIDMEKATEFMRMLFEDKDKEAVEIVNNCNAKVTDTDICEAAHGYGMCILDEFKTRDFPVETLE